VFYGNSREGQGFWHCQWHQHRPPTLRTESNHKLLPHMYRSADASPKLLLVRKFQGPVVSTSLRCPRHLIYAERSWVSRARAPITVAVSRPWHHNGCCATTLRKRLGKHSVWHQASVMWDGTGNPMSCLANNSIKATTLSCIAAAAPDYPRSSAAPSRHLTWALSKTLCHSITPTQKQALHVLLLSPRDDHLVDCLRGRCSPAKRLRAGRGLNC